MDERMIACICEGEAERAILNLLFEQNKLWFSREEILSRTDRNLRNARTFAERYLREARQ